MLSTLKEQIKRLKEKHLSFRDFVKIHLRHLQFNELKQRMLKEDFYVNNKNIARSIQIFEI